MRLLILYAWVGATAGCGYSSRSIDNNAVASGSPAPPITTPTTPPTTPPVLAYDVVVYGATPSGIMAAIQASRLGKTVMLIEPTHWIGGMVSGGLSDTDSGTWSVIGGLALEFFQNTTVLEKSRSVSPIYSNGVAFDVEPHIALQVFTNMLQDAGVAYRVDSTLATTRVVGARITQISLGDGTQYSAKEFIDASYEGDLMAMAGVPYSVGREAASAAEPDAGVQTPDLLFGGIDPYVIANTPSSGLLPQVSDGPVLPVGSPDKHVMAYNYRFCVTDMAKHASNAVPFAQYMPPAYSAEDFAAVQRIISAKATESGEEIALNFFSPGVPYADGKYDVNGLSAFTTDVVKFPDQYPDGTWLVRQSIVATIRNFDQGLLYFLATSPSVPASVRQYVNRFGACKDEFADNQNFPTQLYVREGRRMHGAYVMTEADILNKVSPTPTDVIGYGGYNMDSHIHQILNINGQLYQEGGNRASIGYGCTTENRCAISPGTPFPIPYGALTPAADSITNLLVPVTMSATSTAYRALRLEPQYMIMGQASGAAAALAIDGSTSVQSIPYTQLRAALLTPNFPSQPAQVLVLPCTLKGVLYPSGSDVTGYKATTGTKACAVEQFTCSNGVLHSSSDVSAVPYYNSCAAAQTGLPP